MIATAVSLDIREASVFYGVNRVLDRVSLSAAGGEFIALLPISHPPMPSKARPNAPPPHERNGKTPCRAMHWVSVASVAVKIGFAVRRAKVLWPSPPYVVPSSAKSAWF